MLVKDMPGFMQVDFFKRQLALLQEADPYGLLEKCKQDLKEAEVLVEQDYLRPFQDRCLDWVKVCFGESKAADKEHRNLRFLEEALELVQAGGLNKEAASAILDYVYARDVGELHQEVGGVMTTLAAFCGAHGLQMQECGENELKRVWGKVDKIRQKELGKPKFTLNISNLLHRFHELPASSRRNIMVDMEAFGDKDAAMSFMERERLFFRRIITDAPLNERMVNLGRLVDLLAKEEAK